MLTNPNALAKQAWEDAFNAAMGDVVAGFSDERATAAIAAVYAPRLAELEAEVERLREALEVCVAELYAPDPACSCRIDPPCRDCIDYGAIREAIAVARAALGASHD